MAREEAGGDQDQAQDRAEQGAGQREQQTRRGGGDRQVEGAAAAPARRQPARGGGGRRADQVHHEDRRGDRLRQVEGRRDQPVPHGVVDRAEHRHEQHAERVQPQQQRVAQVPGDGRGQRPRVHRRPPEVPGPGDQQPEREDGEQCERRRDGQAPAPAPRGRGPAGDQASAHPADRVAGHVQAHRGGQRRRVHLLGEVGHRGGREPGERRALDGPQHHQRGQVGGERQREGEHRGGERGGRHHGGAPVAVGQRAGGQQGEREAERGRGGRPAGLTGRQVEVGGEHRQQALGGVQQDEGGDARREQGEVGAAEVPAARAQAQVGNGFGSGRERLGTGGLHDVDAMTAPVHASNA